MDYKVDTASIFVSVCLWTSSVIDQHYIKMEWSARKQAPSAHIVTHVACSSSDLAASTFHEVWSL
jgi:hypothetical protein